MEQRRNRFTKDDQKKQPQISAQWVTCLEQELGILSEHYRQPISKLSMLAYSEDLQSLTVEQLKAACKEARKTSEFLPVSASILQAHRKLTATTHEIFLGPRMIDWDAEETPEEKKERLERKAAFDRQLQETASSKKIR